jgi:hypothetical protein
MDISGTATTTVLMTIVALGAAADIAMEPEHRYAPPAQVTHRGPPGPAQIELAESEPLPTASVVPKPDEQALALLGMDAPKAISSSCDADSGDEALGPEILVCGLAGSEYLSLLLDTVNPPPDEK